MRYDEDGVLWLKPEEWIVWLMKNHPERISTQAERKAYPRVTEAEAARQWQNGRGKGLLGPPHFRFRQADGDNA